MSASITEADAVRRFPELQHLVTARQAGWVFRPIPGEDTTELVGIVGSHTREKYTDALWVYGRTDVVGVRVLDEEWGGGCVWKVEFTDLQEAVMELLALPEPGERLAPSRVLSSSLLWTPR